MTNIEDLSPDDLERFEERAAIMEYDGNMSREDAERDALDDINPDEREALDFWRDW